MKRSWEGVVLKVMGAKDFTLEVTGREEISPDFLRIHVRDGGLLIDSEPHPTMWIRLWFDDAGKGHQRAYTLVNPDARAGTFSMDFAMHDGIAADFANPAQTPILNLSKPNLSSKAVPDYDVCPDATPRPGRRHRNLPR